MSINNNNEKVTAIFGLFFEKGEDGQVIEVPRENTQIPSSSQSFVFRGTLRLENGSYCLWPLSGGKFTISFIDQAIDINTVLNTVVSVTGIQAGDRIMNAVIKNSSTAVTKPANVRRKVNAELLKLASAVKEFISRYKNVPGLVSARPGYKFVDGRITKELAIVAVVDRKINLSSLPREQQLPTRYDNYDVEVVSAAPEDFLKFQRPDLRPELAFMTDAFTPTFLESLVLDPDQTEAIALEAAAVSNNYVPPPHVSLEEITEGMTLVCHVSPEGGWQVLNPFLTDTTEHLQVAMYDFSAPHLFDTLKSVLRTGVSLKMVYDGNPASGVGEEGSKEDDVREETIINSFKRIAGRGFEHIPAFKGSQGICYNSYHIKVAVQDRKKFWLSSGNWQSSNQPNEDFESNISLLPKYNREWNILVDNKKLADIYHQFIDWDFEKSLEKPEAAIVDGIELPEMFLPEEELEIRETSRYMLFPPKKFTFTRSRPLKIQPILSPDNYLQYALEIIKSARQTLYFQNQYIKLPQNITDEYVELLQTLNDKANEVDCRIILRAQRTDTDRKMLEDLQAFGFDMSKIRLMTNTHTKGIIADGERILIGSHNWSNAGVQFNRDASLLIFDAGVAQYYQDVFLHDWDKRTKRTHREEIVIVPQDREEVALLPDNLKPVRWVDLLT